MELTGQAYAKHLQKEHNFPATRCCWCNEFEWIKKRNPQHTEQVYTHRYKCLVEKINKKKAQSVKIKPEIKKVVEEVKVTDLLYNCKKCDEHYKKMEQLKANFTLDVGLPPSFTAEIPISHNWLELDFAPDQVQPWEEKNKISESNVKRKAVYDARDLKFDDKFGIDAHWLRLFYIKTNLMWFHYSIRQQVWDKFYKVANQNTELFCVLPNWCLCNGGTVDIDRHHRHLIIVIEKNNLHKFRKLMNGVTFSNGALEMQNEVGKKVTTKFHCQIISMPYLLNIITYVSGQTSLQCGGAGRDLPRRHKGDIRYQCHYYIASPISEHGRLMMSLLYIDGLQEVTQIEKGHCKVGHLKSIHRKTQKFPWYAKIDELFVTRGHVIPLDYKAIKLMPEEKIKSLYYFLNDRKQSVVLDDKMDNLKVMDICSVKSVNEQAINMGNVMMEVAGQAYVQLTKNQQRILNELQEIRLVIKEKDQVIQIKDEELRKKDDELRKKDELINQLLIKMKIVD